MWWQNKNISNNQLSLGGEFLGFHTPKLNDMIIFKLKGKEYTYKVKEKYLEKYPDCNSRQIFYALGICIELGDFYCEKTMAFCSKAYGYRSTLGQCPECREYDYDALGRLIYYLKLECQKQNNNVVA